MRVMSAGRTSWFKTATSAWATMISPAAAAPRMFFSPTTPTATATAFPSAVTPTRRCVQHHRHQLHDQWGGQRHPHQVGQRPRRPRSEHFLLQHRHDQRAFSDSDLWLLQLVSARPAASRPYYASTQAVAAVTSNTPIYRNITFSNITATSVSGYPIGIIWARTEMPATNIVFNKVNVTGNRNFCLYNVNGAQFIDCNFTSVDHLQHLRPVQRAGHRHQQRADQQAVHFRRPDDQWLRQQFCVLQRPGFAEKHQRL